MSAESVTIKVAFYRSNDGVRNKFIKWWTGSDIVHAELILPDGSMIGISPEDSSRVRRKNAGPEPGPWSFISIKLTPEQFKLLLCFFEMTHGMKYDWCGMILSHVTPFYVKHDKKWYCSQWIACALTYARVHPLFYNKINPGKLHDILSIRVCEKNNKFLPLGVSE